MARPMDPASCSGSVWRAGNGTAKDVQRMRDEQQWGAGRGGERPYEVYLGLRRTMMTESPRRNILEMKRSLLIGLLPAEPLPFFGTWAQGVGRKV